MSRSINSHSEFLIEVSNFCPLNCLFCSSNAGQYRDSDDAKLLRSLSLDALKSYIKTISSFGFKVLQISGGEPFSFPYIKDLILFLSSSNFPLIEIYTSGIYQDSSSHFHSLPGELLDLLSQHNKFKLRFNFQSCVEQTYNFLTGTEGFYSLVVESMKRCRERNIPVEVHLVPMKPNLFEIEGTVSFLIEKVGVNRIKFLRFVSQGRGREHSDVLEISSSLLKTLYKILDKVKKRYPSQIEVGSAFGDSSLGCSSCELGRGKLLISFNNILYPCSSLKNSSIGLDLAHYSLSSLLSGPIKWDFDNVLKCKICKYQSSCKEICLGQRINCNKFEAFTEVDEDDYLLLLTL